MRRSLLRAEVEVAGRVCKRERDRQTDGLRVRGGGRRDWPERLSPCSPSCPLSCISLVPRMVEKKEAIKTSLGRSRWEGSGPGVNAH